MLVMTGLGFFANLLYSVRMPLGFFTFSSPGESITLSPVTLAQYYPGKILIFDAKPLIFEAVTLSLSLHSFCKPTAEPVATPHT